MHYLVKYLKKIRILIYSLFYRRFLKIGKRFSFGVGTRFFAQTSIVIGDDVYIGRYCSIETDAIIGNHVLVANNVGIIGRYDHDMSLVGCYIKNAPCVRDKNYVINEKHRQVIIKDDVWIGFGAIVLSGVEIGQGSIIAAGSIVTEDVKEYTIVAGNPAKFIGQRFDKQNIDLHKSLLGIK